MHPVTMTVQRSVAVQIKPERAISFKIDWTLATRVWSLRVQRPVTKTQR
jgi:hypothetical protein